MPFPGGTFIAQIRQIGASVADEFEQFYALLEGYLRVEHKEDGTHAAINADSVTVTGDVDVDGDVIAQSGSGNEAALGALTSVNGVPLLPLEAIRGSGVLVGGVSDGFFIFDRARATAFTGSGSERQLSIYNLDESVLAPIIMIGMNNGVANIIDGGSGSPGLSFGNVARPIIDILTADLTVTDDAKVGRLAFVDRLVPAEITANVHNYAINTASRVFLSSDGAYDITGIVAGFNGQMLWICNADSGGALTLKNASASSSVGNQILTANAADVVLRISNGSVLLMYDTTAGFWYVVGP